MRRANVADFISYLSDVWGPCHEPLPIKNPRALQEVMGLQAPFAAPLQISCHLFIIDLLKRISNSSSLNEAVGNVFHSVCGVGRSLLKCKIGALGSKATLTCFSFL